MKPESVDTDINCAATNQMADETAGLNNYDYHEGLKFLPLISC